MLRTYSFTLSGQKIIVTKLRAIVLDACPVQETSVWEYPAEGFTSPRFGTSVSAPQIFSQNISFLRITVEYEGGVSAILDVPYNVTASKGDTIEVFFVKNDSEEKEIFGLLKNISTGYLYDFLEKNPSIFNKKSQTRGIFDLFGKIFTYLWRFYPQLFIFMSGIFAYFISLIFNNIDNIYGFIFYKGVFGVTDMFIDRFNSENLFWSIAETINQFRIYLTSIKYKYFSNGKLNFTYSAVLIFSFILLSIRIHRRKQKTSDEIFYRRIREAVKTL